MKPLPASSEDEKAVRGQTGPTDFQEEKIKKSGLTRAQTIKYAAIIVVIIIIITIICTVYLDNHKKNKSEDKEQPKHEKDNINNAIPQNNYITGEYKFENANDINNLLNPNINYLNENDYSTELLEDENNQENSLRELESSYPKILSIKIKFIKPIDTMENMFQNKKNLLKVDLSNLKTHNIKSLANAFSNCPNLETATLGNFDSSNVETMESTFEGCSKLTGLNLSSLNTSKVTSMKSMFKDCESIIFLNLSNLNMTNVQDTSKMFYGCNNLKALDLSSFNNIDNLFDTSSSLLSSLTIKINPNISNTIDIRTDENLNISCNLGEDDKCSECDDKIKYSCESCNEGYYLPKLEFPTFCKKCSIEKCKKCINEFVCEECEDKLSFINGKCMKACDDTNSSNCEKCKTEKDETHQCESCKQGYFLDEDEVNCLECDVEYCKSCLDKKNQAVCESCEDNYYIFNGICARLCSIGEEEKCLSCSDDGTSNCVTCNDYYYLPVNSSNKEVCKKCNIEHCLKCSDSSENDIAICNECEKGYTLSEDKCIISETNNTTINSTHLVTDINNITDFNDTNDDNNKSISNNVSNIDNTNVINDISNINNISDFNNSNIANKTKCTIGSEEKCKSCNNNEEHFDQCETCNPGYYLPIDDELKQECSKCEIENCKICNGTIDSNICYECNDNSTPIYDKDEDKIKFCSSYDKPFNCNPGYKLIDGKCEINYSFKATYYLESEIENENENEDKNVKLLNIKEDKILEMIIDNNIEQPLNYFTFNSTGEHIVFVLLNLNDITSLDSLFSEVNKMIYIEFSEKFITSNINLMGNMFYNCHSLTMVNVSVFNTEKVEDMSNMFYNCSSLKEINLSNFVSNNLKKVDNLFSGCSSLSSIDISNFVLENISDSNSMFEGLPPSGTIKINSNLNEEIKNQIPKDWENITIE